MTVATVSYVERATEYARDVVAGRIVAGKWERLACQRQLDDLADDDGPYYFDDDAAERVCRFIEKLPHIKGRWARERQKIALETWQTFIVTTVFGWKRKEDDLRRFRTVYTEVARKNAKTTKLAGIGLYMLAADDEPGAEVYSAATTRDQAKEVFNIARRMAQKEEGFRDRFGVEVLTNNISIEDTDSKFEPLSADAKTLDGRNPHAAIIDELHAHKTREVFDVIESGTGSREQPLLWSITTAGYDQSGICYEQRTYVTKILDKIIADDTYFGIIYTLDPEDDWRDRTLWRKANPNLGVSVYPDDMERQAVKAEAMPTARNAFLTKRLNIWTSADVAWMKMEKWHACCDESLTLEEFEGERCFVGIDLASRDDMAARMLVFPDGKEFSVFGRYYLPQETIRSGKNASYAGWAAEGMLVATPGEVIDFDFIEEDLRELATRFEIQEVAYDPHQATQFSVHMLAEGFPMVEMRPTTINFSEPMKELEALALEGLLHHDGDPILAWAVSNVVAHLDAKDNIYPRKARPENKIDPVVGLLMALGRAIVTDTSDSMYEDEAIVSA